MAGSAGAAKTPGEAMEKMIKEKKLSSKINYDVLKNLGSECDATIARIRRDTETSISDGEQDVKERKRFATVDSQVQFNSSSLLAPFLTLRSDRLGTYLLDTWLTLVGAFDFTTESGQERMIGGLLGRHFTNHINTHYNRSVTGLVVDTKSSSVIGSRHVMSHISSCSSRVAGKLSFLSKHWPDPLFSFLSKNRCIVRDFSVIVPLPLPVLLKNTFLFHSSLQDVFVRIFSSVCLTRLDKAVSVIPADHSYRSSLLKKGQHDA
eukprot:sb/3468395/